MIRSMTGFASVTVEISGGKNRPSVSFMIEVKTLNGRHFEATSRIPSGLSHLEIPFTEVLKEKLVRGRAFLTIRSATGEASLDRPVMSMEVVQQYIEEGNRIKKQFKVGGELTISEIMLLPHVFSFERVGLTKADEKKLLEGLHEVADLITKERDREGKSLQKDIKARFEQCRKIMVSIRSSFEKFMDTQKDVVKNMVNEAKQGDTAARSQLDDLYAMLNKIDINEEIIRFNSHLSASVKLLSDAKQDEKGRRLDFIIQELAREANTITAKCSSFDIGSHAVDIKVELEKAREQIQNIV